jgi:hypothetical protein
MLESEGPATDNCMIERVLPCKACGGTDRYGYVMVPANDFCIHAYYQALINGPFTAEDFLYMEVSNHINGSETARACFHLAPAHRRASILDAWFTHFLIIDRVCFVHTGKTREYRQQLIGIHGRRMTTVRSILMSLFLAQRTSPRNG